MIEVEAKEENNLSYYFLTILPSRGGDGHTHERAIRTAWKE